MSTIQTVIDQYEEAGCDDTYHEVFFLEESPEVVKASAELRVTVGKYHTITRTVYSLEEYMEMQSRPLSDFCPPAKKGIWWLAVDKGLVDALVIRSSVNHYEAWNDISRHDPVKHYHVTLDYGIAAEDNPHCAWSLSEGEIYYPILVKGLAYNDKAACLVVELKGIESCNARPHITLATADGVTPVYSNQMLAGVDGAYQFLPLEAELEGTLEFFQFQ